MTRKYEVVYIFDSALTEEQINEKLDRFHALLATEGNAEPITARNDWGRRALAYPIKGKDAGYYVVTQFATAPDALAEYERLIKLDEGVMRYLLVVNEGEAPRPIRPDSDGDDDESEDSR